MNTYFKRYAYPVRLFDDQAGKKLKLSVVIPCFNEPEIVTALISLNQCTPVDDTEVIIIVNEAENSSCEIHSQNRASLKQIKKWQSSTKLNFKLLVYHLITPVKDAGVGFARKVGMDEASRRFNDIENENGVICCFDADSTCSTNYLQTVYQHFYLQTLKPNGASIYFEHPLPKDKKHANGIKQYELHLRYYVQALRFIKYPFAHHTVGSSMVVRSDIYQQVGGMNKRKAGEDFYFLHKVMPTGNYIDITDTTIFPSGRQSDRVPFGTGKAIKKWLSNQQQEYYTYNLSSFLELKALFEDINLFYKTDPENYQTLISNTTPALVTYLIHIEFSSILRRLQRQSTTLQQFKRNWYYYFDGFRVLKFLHFAREKFYPDQPVTQEALKLAVQYRCGISPITHIDFWLSFYRNNDKQGLP